MFKFKKTAFVLAAATCAALLLGGCKGTSTVNDENADAGETTI